MISTAKLLKAPTLSFSGANPPVATVENVYVIELYQLRPEILRRIISITVKVI